MSYPRDLDEYRGSELRAEIARREELRDKGLCDYCGRPEGCEPSCKERRRHKGEVE